MTPNEASKGFNMTNIVNDTKEETIIKKETEFKVGDTVRVKTYQDAFIKMKPRFSNTIFTITKVNKNTVNLKDDNEEYERIKKEYLLLVIDVEKQIQLDNKMAVEKMEKVKRKVKKELN